MKITRRDGLKGLAAGAAAVAMPGIVHAEAADIVVGAPNSLTGGLGEIGTRGTWGMQIAVDQINKEGGIKSLDGAKLKLVIADTSSENPTQAASVTRRIIDQDGAMVILGAGGSAMTLCGPSRDREVGNSVDYGVLRRRHCHARIQIHIQALAAGRRGLELVDDQRL